MFLSGRYEMSASDHKPHTDKTDSSLILDKAKVMEEAPNRQ